MGHAARFFECRKANVGLSEDPTTTNLEQQEQPKQRLLPFAKPGLAKLGPSAASIEVTSGVTIWPKSAHLSTDSAQEDILNQWVKAQPTNLLAAAIKIVARQTLAAENENDIRMLGIEPRVVLQNEGKNAGL